ncbi:TetR/AcrR family transcriptional regulator [Sedimentitalea sp. CY04]|uniref:TetR/AcrR family transcriptional regulator n=1 Tax=Parasedimentitalea denitrificans TaxID=2211118 RepID=A0ABX0W634_9RHOB|nr:TetR/AcrR family transcriptional regulator [Sedimentitalea sp. CY04]
MNTRAPQQRRLKTRAKLIEVAQEIVAVQGYSGLRVEDVVDQAGVAKGTLFSHFKDKDGLLAVLIGAEVMTQLDQMEAQGQPNNINEVIDRLSPLLSFIATDRVIFELLLRYSGSTGAEIDEVVTAGLVRQVTLFAGWLAQLQHTGEVRNDSPAELLSEGIQAFLYHVLALWFCIEHTNDDSPATSLQPFLHSWLAPKT